MISLPDAPHNPLSFLTTSSNGISRFRYPPRALACSIASFEPCSILIPSTSS